MLLDFAVTFYATLLDQILAGFDLAPSLCIVIIKKQILVFVMKRSGFFSKFV